MSNTHFHGDIAVSDLPNGHAVYSFKNTSVVKGESAISTIQIDTKEKTSAVIASWGLQNDYPQKVIEASRKNTTLSRSLQLNCEAHYGNGIILQSEFQADENGKKTPSLLNIKDYLDVNEFFRRSQVSRFAKETIMDIEWWDIAFPEYILSNNFAAITRVRRQPAAWCRFQVMNLDNGLVENVYISQKFGIGSVDIKSNFVATVPLIDSYWSAEEVREYCKANKIYKFIRPAIYSMLSEPYYPKPTWHSVIDSGWLENANSVPEYIKSIFNNQVSIKYLVEFDERYFENVYSKGKWIEMDVTAKKEIRRSLIDMINSSLGGNKNAGKSIQSMMFVDDAGVQTSAIKITAIDDKLKKGAFLPEASAANSEIAVGAGIDATLLGGAGIPGGSLGAGSGSDKREAFTILSALKKSKRETSIEPLEFIKDFNKWDDEIKFSHENMILTTLDKNPTGTQTVQS